MFLKDLQGTTRTIDTSFVDSVRNLKAKVRTKLDLPPISFRLIHNGKQLEDHDTVRHAGLSKECTVYVKIGWKYC